MILPRLPWYAWAGLAGLFALGVGGGKAAGAALKPSQGGGGPPPPPPPHPMLKLGSTGPHVSWLQAKLGVPVTGSFDAATSAAVKSFQASKGLAADGIVGPMTWGALGLTSSGGGGAPAKAPSGPSYGSSAKDAAQAAVNTQAAPPPAGTPQLATGGGLAQGQAAREQQILDAVATGHGVWEWATVVSKADGHTLELQVFRRALAIDVGTGRLMVSVSFKTAQKLADLIGAIMLTTKVSDLVWQQADVRLPVSNQYKWVQDGSMAHTNRMIEYSNIIEQKVAGRSGLVANEGKDWVTTIRFWKGNDTPEGTKSSRHNSANFGWYGGGSKSPGGETVTQSVGLAHDKNHSDYSQLIRFMQPVCILDGAPRTVASVLADPQLCKLLSDEGPLPGTRHPDL